MRNPFPLPRPEGRTSLRNSLFGMPNAAPRVDGPCSQGDAGWIPGDLSDPAGLFRSLRPLEIFAMCFRSSSGLIRPSPPLRFLMPRSPRNQHSPFDSVAFCSSAPRKRTALQNQEWPSQKPAAQPALAAASLPSDAASAVAPGTAPARRATPRVRTRPRRNAATGPPPAEQGLLRDQANQTCLRAVKGRTHARTRARTHARTPARAQARAHTRAHHRRRAHAIACVRRHAPVRLPAVQAPLSCCRSGPPPRAHATRQAAGRLFMCWHANTVSPPFPIGAAPGRPQETGAQVSV